MHRWHGRIPARFDLIEPARSLADVSAITDGSVLGKDAADVASWLIVLLMATVGLSILIIATLTEDLVRFGTVCSG